MKHVSRIAFAFAFAASVVACGPQNPADPVDCVTNPDQPDCVDTTPCVDDLDCHGFDQGECIVGVCASDDFCSAIDVCDTPQSAELFTTFNDNGSAFLDGVFDGSAAYSAALDADDAYLDSIPIDGCIEGQPPFASAETPASMGDLIVSNGGTTLATIAPTVDQLYEQILASGTVVLGDSLDLEIAGAGSVGATTLPDFIVLPPAFPVFTGTVNGSGQLELGQTIGFEPLAVDRMAIRFSFLEGQNPVTLTCGVDPSAGTFTLDAPSFARIPQGGSFFVTAFNRRRGLLATPEPRSIRSTTQVSRAVTYLKP